MKSLPVVFRAICVTAPEIPRVARPLGRMTDQPFLVLLVLISLTSPLCLAAAAPGDEATRERRYRRFQEKRQEILLGMQADLLAIEQSCLDLGLPDAAAAVRLQTAELTAAESRTSLPRLATAQISENPGPDDQQWQIPLRRHQTERSIEMYRAARDALRAGFPSLAYAMVGDVVRLDPDHKQARSVLGYEHFVDPERKDEPLYAGEWVSPFEARMRRGPEPSVDHELYGWIPASDVTRYEQGLRPWKGDWISAAKESELRRDFGNAWDVRSEHFLIRTNVSREAAVRLSRHLEVFHDWLQQNLAGFFETPAVMRDRLENTDNRRRVRKDSAPMEVHFFATRDEYNRRVSGKVPPNIETNGLYWQPDRRCYLFARPDDEDLSTLFHEATHQILDLHTTADRLTAARARARKLRQKGTTEWILCEHSNFWMIEGLACYFESFTIHDQGVSVGRPDFVRFESARHRLLHPENFYYIPFRSFFGMGKEAWQRHPDLPKLYTQASGVVHFMMHYQNGVYRDDFVALLAAAYRPDPTNLTAEPSFEKISGVKFEELDSQYRLHLLDLEEQVLAAEPETGQVTP